MPPYMPTPKPAKGEPTPEGFPYYGWRCGVRRDHVHRTAPEAVECQGIGSGRAAVAAGFDDEVLRVVGDVVAMIAHEDSVAEEIQRQMVETTRAMLSRPVVSMDPVLL